MILKLKQTPGIYLAGFMASGKTTIGRMLAERLGWTFIDLDQEIETRQGASIPEIFDRHGEPEFRRIETEALRAHVRTIQCGQPSVVALGGGTFVQPGNFDLVVSNGITIWLDCPLETVRRRITEPSGRPLARDADRFEELYHERHPAYARAEYRIAIENDDPEVVVEAILKLPAFS